MLKAIVNTAVGLLLLTARSGVAQSPAVDRIVHDLCDKRVALLGESPMHGFGEVLQLKTVIARRLVDECHFNAFFIESGAYDFLKIQETLKAGSPVDQSAIAAAIGGIWAYREVEPLIQFLWERAQRGTLALGGLDDQLGRGTYAQHRMPLDLVESLPASERQRCLDILQRHMLWKYDDAAPYGPKDKALILGCLDAIERTHAAPSDSVANEYKLAMVKNLRRLLDRDFRDEAVAGVDLETRNFNDRDRSMFMNFEWFMSRLPAGSKVIVWTATIHAAKTLHGVPGQVQRVSLGSYIRRRFGSEAFVLGSSAYSGTYGMARQPARPLPAAPANSLEGRLFDHGEVETRYLDPSELRALGTIPARPLGVDFKATNWSDVLDGIVVVREEYPPHPSVAPSGASQPAFDQFTVFETPTRLIAAKSGAKLALYCAGEGKPTVILESGAGGNTAQSWYRVFPLIARRTHVCAYDRAGFGFSQLGMDIPRDLNHDLADLHEVLHGSGSDGPFILIGHSMGGTIVAAFADRFPEDVAALAMIEPAVVLSTEELSGPADSAQRARLDVQLRKLERCAQRFASANGPAHPAPNDPCLDSRDFDALPPAFARIEAEHEARPEYWRALASEVESNWTGTISRQAAELLPHRWGALPVRVVTAAVSEMSDSAVASALGMSKVEASQLAAVRANHRVWEERQARLCTFSTDCTVIRVRTADHYVQNAAPDTVAAILGDLYDHVARPRGSR